MSDVDCPYCQKEVEINHDDGYGYTEGKPYFQECGECGKTFQYYTAISFSYESYQAPCMNGEPHDWKKIVGYPSEYWDKRRRCSYCDEEKVFMEEGLKHD